MQKQSWMGIAVAAALLVIETSGAAPLEGRNVHIERNDAGLYLYWLGITNAAYEAQVSTNLMQGNWGYLDTVIGADGLTAYPVETETNAIPTRLFRVLFPQPAVSAGEPSFVTEEGGTTIYVTGQYFYDGDQIYVDGILLDNVTFISSTLLSGTLPDLPPGLHKIEVVRGQGGGVLATLPDALEVSPPLERTLQGPPEWPPAGPAPALVKSPGHVTVLKSCGGGRNDGDCDDAEDYRGQGHVTVLKSSSGGLDDDCDGAADVALFSGEVRVQATDLAVPGQGLDFVWTRTYRSRTGAPTSQGNRWSHSYDVRAVQNGDTVSLSDGTGRKDIFRRQANGTYACPEFFREGTLDATTGVFRLTFADTGYWEFNPQGDSPAAGKLARIVDRNGNTMALEHDSTGRLTAVVDDLGRTNTVSYNEDGLVSAVTDFSGRAVSYEYDSESNLTARISPAVTGTSTGNDFPGGKTNRYTYSTGYADERQNHLLLSTVNAEGQTVRQFVYQHDDSDFGFLRCVSVQRGTGITLITYKTHSPSPDNRFAALRCIVNDPEGNVSEHDFDLRNRRVALREYTGRATPGQPVDDNQNRPVGKLREGDPDVFETRWSWNNDSLCTAWRQPGSNRVEWVYQADLDTSTSPRFRANLRAERRVPLGDLDGDGRPDVIVSRFEHDPRFGSSGPSRLRNGARGVAQVGLGVAGSKELQPWYASQPRDRLSRQCQTASGEAYTTGEVCDDGRMCDSGHSSFITRVTDPLGFVATCDYDAHGNLLTLARHGADDGSGVLPVLAREDYEYNAHGQLTALVHAADGEGRRRRDEYIYHASGPQAGYLASAVVDAGPTGRNLDTGYEYDACGHLVCVTDPRGTATEFVVNAHGQTVSKQTQGASFGERVRSEYRYDAADRIVRVEHGNLDGSGSFDPNGGAIAYEYDALGRLIRKVAGAADASFAVTNEYVYDGNDRLVLARSPLAVQGIDPHHATQYEYDERGRLFGETRAPGAPEQVETRYDYDANGNCTRVSKIDAFTIKQKIYAYDGMNRCIRATDPMGNETRCEYDFKGNLTRKLLFGETIDQPGGAGNRRLAETRYEYDPLNRLVRLWEPFFDIFTGLPIGDGVQDNSIAYAPNGLVVATTNDRGHATTFTYDTSMFLSAIVDAKTNRIEYTHDANGNILSATEIGRDDLGGTDQIFVRHFAYDALDRCTADWDNMCNTNQYAYDSRNNRVRHTDPLGFYQEGDFDGISRPTSNRKGMGGSAQNSSHYTWDAASRLVAATDSNSNTTQYAYDSLDRLVKTTFADGTTQTNKYDLDGNLVWTRDANGTEITGVYDALGRCVLKNIVPGPGIATNTTQEQFAYDGMSRLISAANNHTEVTRAYDSLGRCVRESTASPSLGFNPREYTRTWNAHGLMLAQTYPSGRSVGYAYDQLDRPTAIGWRAERGVPYANVGELAYIGPGNIERVTRPNGIQTDYGYSGCEESTNSPGDFGWQQVRRVSHTSGDSTPLDVREFAYDRNQNKIMRALTAPFAPDGFTNRQEFTYDSLNRLAQSRTATNGVPAQDTSYTLDPMGNRQLVVNGGTTGNYQMDNALPDPADYQVHQYTVTPFDTRQYDENGNLRQTLTGDPLDPERTFVYDYADRLVAVQGTNGPVAAYAYDALGRRIAKVVYAGQSPALTNRYLYADGQVIEEENGDGTVARTHVAPHVFDQKQLITITGDGEVLYHHSDDQGNLIALTDKNGHVVERFDYDDFGAPQFLDAEGHPRPAAKTSLSGVTDLFHGMPWNEESGLYGSTDLLDPNTDSTLSRTHVAPHVFETKGRAFAGNNPWSGNSDAVTLLGGAIPGGAVISAAVSSVVPLGGVRGGAASASYARTGNSMPSRMSMNFTTSKQTQGATFGEKVNAGLHAPGRALAQGGGLSSCTIMSIGETMGLGRAGGGTRVQDHNSSRSNKTASSIDLGDWRNDPGGPFLPMNKAELIEAIAKGALTPTHGGTASFDLPSVQLIVPVAMDKGLR